MMFYWYILTYTNMAFRKSVRSSYVPSPVSSGFGEIKFAPSSRDDSSISMAVFFEDPEVISDSALPMVDLGTLVASGQRIDGSVDFAPSDPAVRDYRVATSISNYASHVTPNTSGNEN